MHDNFIQNVNGNRYKAILDSCDTIGLFKGPNKEEYKNMCKKLSRNLLLLADSNYKDGNYFKYCDMLYIWIYFEIRKNGLTNSIIEKVFKDLVRLITQKLQKQACYDFSFSEKLKEPEKLIKLRIFQYNTSTIKNILNSISDPDNCSCLEYVYECINIYNDMNNRLCATHKDKNTTNKCTCDILQNFYTSYSSFFDNVNDVNYKLPSLSDTTTATRTPIVNHVPICLRNKPKSELDSSGVDQSGSPKKISISTALSTMVGIPPFLALIYKVNMIYT
ncbi:hypothetical protein PVBG_04789 [Plasmodium vivax Brazil I]|uniref:Variable surface protein n=1 Tax=Plasmodium vivax (strain Brazil I) TaxID=1033975 RepID=A0A0J9SZL1_PLAV1|nr:hypothetical protein PVBG_04789 [Plasmodium vivax Brazil I]